MNDTFKSRVLADLLPLPTETKVVLITGARQTGKSTLVQHQYPELKYFNLDAFEIREQMQLISSFDWGKIVNQSILDEAQKEPGIFEKTKFAFDAKQLSFIVLLGSSQVLMLKQIRESLAGRVTVYELFPLMACEIETSIGAQITTPLLDSLLCNESIDKILFDLPVTLLGNAAAAKKNAEQYQWHWGGMPKLLHLNGDERKQWLADYEYTYLQRDLADLAKISDLQPFHKLQRLAALRSGKLLNFSELSRDVGMSVDTSRRYVEYLKLSYQAILLQPFYSNQTTSTIKTPKLYWLDIGILRYLTGYWGELSGELYETYIISEIYKWITTRRQQVEMFFYRTHSGIEVDLILQIQQKHIGIEIKSRSRTFKQDANALIKLAELLGNSWLGGIVIYQGDIIQKIAEPNIWAIPSWRLLI